MASAKTRAQLEHLKALALYFSVVALGTSQFIRHGRPSPDVVSVSPTAIVLVLVLVVLLPAIALFAIDRVLAIRDPSGKSVRQLRTIVFAGALVLIARHLFLYFGPVREAIEPLTSTTVTALLVGVLAITAAAWVARRGYEHCQQFFVWMAAPALLMVVVVTGEVAQAPAPSGYATETPVPDESADPVFVLVFDEMSFDVLSDGGAIDAESYPNLAALAGDGAWLTNATTNYFHTTFVVPRLFDGVRMLGDDYQVRLYSQYGYVEGLLHDGCGSEYTCRGQGYLASEHPGTLVGDVLVRTLYQAAPGVAGFALDPPMKAVTGALGTALPEVDRLGMHTFTEDQWDQFMGDVGAEQSGGRAYFVHVLLPHTPFIYDRDGNRADSDVNGRYSDEDADPAEVYKRYAEQTRYADKLVGEFVARLKDEGLYERSTIVITGDHGLRREDPTTKDGADELDSEAAHVPFIVKAPGVAPQVVANDYQHIDFAATLADALGRTTTGLDGLSAFSPDRPQRDKVLYADDDNERYWEYVFDAGSGRWLLERFVEGPLPETPELAVRSLAGD